MVVAEAVDFGVAHNIHGAEARGHSRAVGALLKADWYRMPWESHGRSGLRFPQLKGLRAALER